jgi:sulfur carrier protein
MSAQTETATDTSITIVLGHDTLHLPAGSTLADLVAQQGHAPQAVSTALNGQFVARSLRGSTVLQPRDTVQFFQPIVGG